MTNNPFEREKKAQFKRFVADVRQTREDIDAFLKKAKEEIRSRLATAPSDYQMWALTNVQKDIERVAEELKSDLRSVGTVGFDKAVETGAALVDEPVKAMFKFDLNARVQRADTEQIKAMRSFMTDRLADIGEQAKKKISEQMGLCLIGAQNPFQAAREIAAHLDANGRARAYRIVNTELGRAFSVATQERLMQAREAGLKMKKQWRRSGKIHSRLTHDMADGQVVDADEPFTIGGVKMMYPRDPTAPAAETINCGCVCLPYMDDWEVEHPADVPFTADELNKSNEKRIVQDVRREDYANWADKILNRAEGTYPDGTSKTVGVIDAGIMQALKVRGIEPFSEDISVTDKQLIHLSRAVKQARGQQIDLNTIKHLPDRLVNADVVLRSKNKNELIYAFKRPDGLYDKVAVNLQRKEDNAKNAQSRNWIVTAGKMEEQNLRNENAYEILKEK